ncbi:hypothetical protein BH10ACI1_BH10ACI1_17980 [soil metagenome]
MDNLERVITESLQRIDRFGIENAAGIAANAKAFGAFAAISNFVAQLDETGALRTSAGVTKLTQTGFRRMKRTQVKGFLLRMKNIARDNEKNNPAFVNKFRLREDDKSDAMILETARAFHADAAAVKTDFIDYGLASDFLTNLQTMIDEFAQAIGEQDTANRSRIGANATIDDIVDHALTGRRTLLVIVPLLFADNPGKLAEWAAASHIERPKPKPRTNPTS